MKLCRRCGTTKELDQFTYCPSRGSGTYLSNCKSCEAIRKKEYATRNKNGENTKRQVASKPWTGKPAGKVISAGESQTLLLGGLSWCYKCQLALPTTSFAASKAVGLKLARVCNDCKWSYDYELRIKRSQTKKEWPLTIPIPPFEATNAITSTQMDYLFESGHGWCNSCKIAQPLERFNRKASRRLGYNDCCKDCFSDYRKKRGKSDLEKQATSLRYRLNACVKAQTAGKQNCNVALMEQLIGISIAEFVEQHPLLRSTSASIDHICPSSQAKNGDELLSLQHHSNLQVLTKLENGIKSSRWTPRGEEVCRSLLGRDWIYD